MSTDTPQRPGQATLAGWLIIGGSAVLVLSAWQRIAGLHTLEVQEEFQRILAEPPLNGTGLTMDGLATTVRVLSMVAAGAATAATILGFQAMRRSTSARVALTCLAPLVLIGGFATAGFFAPMVVAGITLLWLQPTRDWFAGRTRAARAETSGGAGPERRDAQVTSPVDRDPAPDPATAPSGSGPALAPGSVLPGGTAPRPASYPPPAPAADRGGRRPAALIWACSIVWVSTLMVVGGLLVVTLAVAFGGDYLFDEFERQQGSLDELGVTRDDLRSAVYLMTALAVPWALAAATLALVAFFGKSWARIALAVSSVLAGLLMLVASVANPLLVVLVAACAVTTWLLLRPDVAAWRR